LSARRVQGCRGRSTARSRARSGTRFAIGAGAGPSAYPNAYPDALFDLGLRTVRPDLLRMPDDRAGPVGWRSGWNMRTAATTNVVAAVESPDSASCVRPGEASGPPNPLDREHPNLTRPDRPMPLSRLIGSGSQLSAVARGLTDRVRSRWSWRILSAEPGHRPRPERRDRWPEASAPGQDRRRPARSGTDRRHPVSTSRPTQSSRHSVRAAEHHQ
jgi:hypothetical protein